MKKTSLWILVVICQFLLLNGLFAEEKEDLQLSQEAPAVWYKPIWTSTNLQFITGDDYETGGDDRQETYSLESASGWVWGDNFMFFDHTDIDDADDTFYFEIHPRLSLSYLTGKDLSFGFVKDVFVATEYNRDDAEFEAYLYGAGLALDVPGFNFVDLNLYCRDDKNLDGTTWQVSFAWEYPFSISELDFIFSGFFDYAGEEHDSCVRNFLIEPRLLVDFGKFFGNTGHFYTGVEYKKWNNKYGIDGMDEEVTNFTVLYKF